MDCRVNERWMVLMDFSIGQRPGHCGFQVGEWDHRD